VHPDAVKRAPTSADWIYEPQNELDQLWDMHLCSLPQNKQHVVGYSLLGVLLRWQQSGPCRLRGKLVKGDEIAIDECRGVALPEVIASNGLWITAPRMH
jgi:hypothetical protein